MNYLLLVAGILCALVAFICIVFCTSCWINSNEDDTESQVKLRRWLILGMSIGFLVAAYIGWRIYSYLSLANPDVLEAFGLWYVEGYTSRFLVLVKRHEVLSSRFATDWDEVFSALFWALLGPSITLHLIKVLIWEKNRFD